MFTETFKNDYRVISKPTSFSSIQFPVKSIYQSDTTSPSQTAYMSQSRTHQRTHLHISKCTHHYTKMCNHHCIHSDYYNRAPTTNPSPTITKFPSNRGQRASIRNPAYHALTTALTSIPKHTSKYTIMYTHSYIFTYNRHIHL